MDKAFDIIELLVANSGGGVTEIAEQVDLSPSTVHAHLTTLRERGYLINRGTEYDVSTRFLNFGTYARNNVDRFDTIKSTVDHLAAQTDERAQFMIEEHGRGVYLYEAEGELAVPDDTRLGKPRYLHMCSSGKAILAHLPVSYVERIVAHWGLPKQTERTITDEEALFAELDRVREAGIATNQGEALNGLFAAGAPIVTRSGALIGSICISGPAHRLAADGEVRDRYRNELISAIEEIELNLTYS